ncbi:MAG: caspase family protein [Endozoicomonas sp. (ex Botrylloides leachii)]|nr:caspase family protein [Endozoicomonas sp. (ex Botrylloides leachii)]
MHYINCIFKHVITCIIFLSVATSAYSYNEINYLPVRDQARTKFLLVGQNYPSRSYQLNGCYNDANRIKNFFSSFKGYDAQIELLTDEKSPIKKIDFLYKLSTLAKETHAEINPIRQIMISYSGHGLQQRKASRQETDRPSSPGKEDGKDECLFLDDQILSDNELHNALKDFHKDSKIIFLVDACHSGTILDLGYLVTKENNGSLISIEREDCTDIDANVLCISGCLDAGTSAETFNPDLSDEENREQILNKKAAYREMKINPESEARNLDGAYAGILTTYFIDALISYSKCPLDSILNELYQKRDDNGVKQRFCFSSNRPINLGSTLLDEATDE